MGSRTNVLFAIVVSVAVLTSGCAPKFACEGSVNLDDPRCNSVSNMYEIKMRGKADPQDKDSGDKKEKTPPVQIQHQGDMSVALVKGAAYEAKIPVRVPPKVIRIWIAPWEDADGDLHQPGYIFSEINDKRGRWAFGEKQVAGSVPLLSPVERTEETAVEESTSGRTQSVAPATSPNPKVTTKRQPEKRHKLRRRQPEKRRRLKRRKGKRKPKEN